MTRFVLSGFLAFCLQAQSVVIDTGSLTDQYFTGGAVWTDPAMGADPTLRYGPFFSYDVPLANGFYSVTFRLIEPNKTAANQRRFTITANGVQSDAIDVFALAGGVNIPYSTSLLAMVGNGHLRIVFLATLSNAVVSAIEIEPQGLGGWPMPITMSQLPGSCKTGDSRYVLDASTAAGAAPYFLCGPDDTWKQTGLQGDGMGVMVILCSSPGVCLAGVNIEALKALLTQ